jgi:hypothetical protein
MKAELKPNKQFDVLYYDGSNIKEVMDFIGYNYDYPIVQNEVAKCLEIKSVDGGGVGVYSLFIYPQMYIVKKDSYVFDVFSKERFENKFTIIEES